MEDQLKDHFTDTPPKPSVAKVISDLQARVLASPVFVCLICTKVSSSQQAMASHCRQHVREGMAKGTVRHIKCCPDHTESHFLCISPPPSPGDSGSANRIKQVPLESYKTVFAYAGSDFISHIKSSLPEKPNGVGPDIDLTLRLGPTPGTTADDSQGMSFSSAGSSSSASNTRSGEDPKGKKVIPGPWN